MTMVKHILLIDDEENVLFILRDILQRQGGDLEVTTAHTPAEAMRLLRQNRFDLVITDVHLPLMSGIELTEVIKRCDPDMPVIWITACDSKIYRRQAAQMHVYRCLEKPVGMAEFRRAAQEALGQVAPY